MAAWGRLLLGFQQLVVFHKSAVVSKFVPAAGQYKTHSSRYRRASFSSWGVGMFGLAALVTARCPPDSQLPGLNNHQLK